MLKGFDVGVGHSDLPANFRERTAKPQTISRARGGFQDVAHLRFGAAAVLRGSQLQGAMRLFRGVTDGDSGDDGAPTLYDSVDINIKYMIASDKLTEAATVLRPP